MRGTTPLQTPPSPEWKPLVPFDFLDADSRIFNAARVRFRELTKDLPLDPPVSLPDGWHTINPQTAEGLLRRNTRNRPVEWQAVLAYGTHMLNNRWKKTGEPVIINGNTDVDDAGHRLWACYFSGASFTTYVVNVDADPDLFAYIDSGRSRHGGDTLVTAGLGDQSGLLARIIKQIAMPFDEGRLCYIGRMAHAPCTNVDILDYVRANPEITETIKTVQDLYQAGIKRLDDRSVACFVGWKIQTMFGSAALEDFFTNLVKTDLPQTHPIAALQKRLDEHLAGKVSGSYSPKRKMVLTPVKILALTIKAFNMTRTGGTTRRLDPRADDPFPEFETTETDEQREAA